MKIKFTFNPKIPNDKVKEWKDYVKDSVHDLSDFEAERWIRRGVAEEIREVEKLEKEIEEKVKEPKIEEPKKVEEVKKEEVKELEPEKVETTETIQNPGTIGTVTNLATLGIRSRQVIPSK